MPQYQTVDLTVEKTAEFLGVTPATVRRRLAARELRAVKPQGENRELVRLVPYEDWLRVDDAAGLLGLSTSTVRAAAARGELAGRRDRKTHRWQVQLLSVLEDRRCDPRAVALFTGAAAEPGPAPEPRARASRAKRDVFFRLDVDDVPLLEQLREEYGTYEAAIVLGLRAIAGDAATGDELAELHADLATVRGELERTSQLYDRLRRRAEGRVVDELYCPSCERLVAIEEFELVELEDGDRELFHHPHGHRHGSKLRASTVAARQKSQSSTT